jgi:hypothetical protein
MAGTSIQDIRDFHDVIRLLEEHPEWQADLRRVLLTKELLALPDQVAQLAGAQTRTESHLVELVEAQRRTDAQVVQLSERMAELVRAQERTETQLATLTDVVQHLGVDVGRLKGDSLEMRYFRKGVPFILHVLRRPHTLSPEELDSILEDAENRELLSAEESDKIILADLVIRGKRRGTGAEAYLVVEVSWGVGLDDVQRAAERAALLAKAGLTTIPAVAGEWITPDAQEFASAMKVWRFTPSGAAPPSAA